MNSCESVVVNHKTNKQKNETNKEKEKKGKLK